MSQPQREKTQVVRSTAARRIKVPLRYWITWSCLEVSPPPSLVFPSLKGNSADFTHEVQF